MASIILPYVDPDMSNEAYHSSPGISKSGLWTIHQQSEAHYKYGEREESAAFDFGTASHLAILQPNEFETKVLRGPADRRGNAWKDAQAEATNTERLLLTAGDYDDVLLVRDSVHSHPLINSVITQGKPEIEHSGFWQDAETGSICRVRPDLYRPDMSLILDVKTTASARLDEFMKSSGKFGYHMQEAFYTDGWKECGRDVSAFLFLAIEKKKPFAFDVFELNANDVAEGRAAYRNALARYAEADRTGIWPSYFNGTPKTISLARWFYTETEWTKDDQ